MHVPILKQGDYLIATIQSVLSDADLLQLRDDLADRVGQFRSRGVIIDVTVLDVIQGPVEFVDTRSNKRSGSAYIRPVQSVLSGTPFGRPYNAPFSVR